MANAAVVRRDDQRRFRVLCLRNQQLERLRSVIVVETDPLTTVPSYDAWWEVVPAEVSEQDGVRKARQDWSANKKRQRRYL